MSIYRMYNGKFLHRIEFSDKHAQDFMKWINDLFGGLTKDDGTLFKQTYPELFDVLQTIFFEAE